MFYLSHSGYDYSRKRCVDASQWFMNQYLPRHNVDVNVHHCRLEKRENVYGWAWAVDCDYRPREFDIEISNQMPIHLYTQTLLHELWHVYQHVKGHLRDKYGKRHWKGVDHSQTSYEDQPWEIEAHSMEEKLYREYISNSSYSY